MSSFICQKCKDTHGSELEDEEEYLEEDEEESIDDEEIIGDDESIETESDTSNHELIINEPAAQPQPTVKSPVKSIVNSNVKIENSLVIENSNSNELVQNAQKVSPSSKRKATTFNSDLLAEKAVVKQTVNGVKAIRKKQTTTKSTPAKQAKQETVKEDDSQLYCFCRQPYNESQFYVQCESASCLEWYHGRSHLLKLFYCSRIGN